MGKRTEKKIKDSKKNDKLNEMIRFLEEKYKREIKYSYFECLKIAYNSEKNGINGYVTDDELIESSNNKLKHK